MHDAVGPRRVPFSDALSIEYACGGLSPEIRSLRQATFGQEREFLADDQIEHANDHLGVHITLVLKESGDVVGATHVMCAEDSDFPEHVALGSTDLQRCAYSSRTALHRHYRNRGHLSLLMYLANRWARMQGREFFLGFLEEGEPPVKRLLHGEIVDGAKTRWYQGPKGEQYPLHACIQSVDASCYYAYHGMPRSLQDWVRKSLYADELLELWGRRLQEYYQHPFFAAVHAGRLTKHQYIASLANMYQYVKWTTRLLGHAIAISDQKGLRGQYIEHLRGEVDHEEMLIRDLAELGFDTEYLRLGHAPSPAIFSFMSIQQSLVGFERDPALFLMVPLVAEGLSANLTKEFLRDLEQCIASWGIQRPRSAVTFLRSHIHTDGGEDGHWQMVRARLGECLSSETELQRARCIIQACFDHHIAALSGYLQARRPQVFEPAFPSYATADSGLPGGMLQ